MVVVLVHQVGALLAGVPGVVHFSTLVLLSESSLPEL